MSGGEIAFSIAASMVGRLIAGLLLGGSEEAVVQKEPKPSQARPKVVIEEKVEVAKLRRPEAIRVPSFLMHVPQGHFAGVSGPMGSLAEARKGAIGQVVRQIVSAINIRYDHTYYDRASGNIRSPRRIVDDRLTAVASGVVLGVEQGIVESSYCRDHTGRYIFFLLVRYPQDRIEMMRRLSQGAKVTASLVRLFKGSALLKVSESNGVGVVLSSIDANMRKVNQNAGMISKFIWKVSSGSSHSYSVALDKPINICGGSREVSVPLRMPEKKVKDFLLGSKFDFDISLKGHDELGRPVVANVSY